MAERIRTSHARVQGDQPRAYSAFSSEAQLWVLATLIALSIQLYERLVAPLTENEKQEYLSDMKVFGTWFGLPVDYGPLTWPEFIRYYEDKLRDPEMASLPISRELATHIAYPRSHFFLRAGWPFTSALTRELLPSPLRERLGFEQNRKQQDAANFLLGAARFVLPGLPPELRFARQYREATNE